MDQPRQRPVDPTYSRWLCALFVVLGPAFCVQAHVFVPKTFRLGAFPPYEGSGWEAEVYLNIPDASAEHLLIAENWIASRAPDFTFLTDWIDFPAGPVTLAHDADLETMADFLDGHIHDVSDPAMLNEPFGNFIIKFSGYLRVAMEDDTPPDESVVWTGLPVWVDFGTAAQDGYRLVVGQTIYRFPLVGTLDFFWREQPILESTGMFRIEFTYFNKYDPFGSLRTESTGVELNTWHGGGLPWPSGNNMIHPRLGPGTIIPPRIIYRLEDIQPLMPGDFDADSDVDAQDARWFQTCFTGPPDEGVLLLDIGCERFDFDEDVDVDAADYALFLGFFMNP